MKLKNQVEAMWMKLRDMDFFQKSPLIAQKKGDPTLSLDQYKWASLECLFIFPIVMSILIIPLAYKKSAWSFFKEYWIGSLPKEFTWNTYVPIVITIYYCCILVHIIITVFFLEKIRIKADFIKKGLTLVLPVYLIIQWGELIKLDLNKTKFLVCLILLIIINWIFAEIFEYINMRAGDKWYVTNQWKYGWDFSDLIYYVWYAVLTLLAVCVNNPIIIVVSALLLIGLSVLLGLSRKSINNLIACEIVIMTASMHTYKLIDLEMCVCVMLSLYFTEQLQMWINRSIKGTTGKEQKKYISDIKKKVLSGYGLAGIAIFIAITLLEHGL